MGKQLVQADKVLCKSVLQAIMDSQSFRLAAQMVWKLYKVAEQPMTMRACQTIYRCVH